MAETWTRRRTTRGVARAVGALAAVLGLAVATAACGGGTSDHTSVRVEVDDKTATPADAIARAAEATASVESGRMRGVVDYSVKADGQDATATMTMDGAFADKGHRTEMTADMGAYLRGLAGQLGQPATGIPDSMVMRMVLDGTDMYMKFDVDPPGPGTEFWYHTDLSELGLSAQQMGNAAGLGGGPTSYLESLKGAGADVVEVGPEDLDGVPVTRYEGTSDPQVAVERAAPEKRAELRSMLRASGMNKPMPFVAWVDGDGILRRMQMTMSMDMGKATMTGTATIDYFDFGADVSVTTPPADLVRDSSELTGLGA